MSDTEPSTDAAARLAQLEAENQRLRAELAARACAAEPPSVPERVVEARRQHEAELNALLDSLPFGVFIKDRAGRFTRVNRLWAEMAGLPMGEIVGRTIYDLVPEMPAHWRDADAALFATGEPQFVEQQIPPETSARIGIERVETRRVPLRDADGAIVALLGVTMDVTARAAAERERARVQTQLTYHAHLLAHVRDAIVASDAQYRLTVWNAAAEDLYGWKAAEVLGRVGLEVVQTQYAEADREEMLHRIAAEGHWRGEVTQVRKDGTRIPVEVASIVLRDEQGQITGYVSVNRDITGRRRAQAALRQQAAIIESSQDAIIGKTLEGVILSWNAAAERMYGYSPAEAIGQSISMLVPPDRHDDIPLILRRIRQGEHIEVYETERVRKDGQRLDVSLSISPVLDGRGAVEGAATIARDVTARKQAEREREALIAQLQEALANVRTLRGMVPICANCKKIRDDAGFWQQVEVYVRDHSEAEFTHGICPECMRRLYPEFLEDDEA